MKYCLAEAISLIKQVRCAVSSLSVLVPRQRLHMVWSLLSFPMFAVTPSLPEAAPSSVSSGKNGATNEEESIYEHDRISNF